MSVSIPVCDYCYNNPGRKQQLCCLHCSRSVPLYYVICRKRSYRPCNRDDEISFCKSHNIKEPIWSSGGSTIAVCGLDYYNNNRIPEWKHSLLMMTLKNS